jgi:tRNA uridine 5-carboxymethylaminomethyl modification enzyme
MKVFDVIVVGGGHAGIEAAWISHQMGLNVALVTLEGVPLASTPCNPAIGGVGKGQVVREVDALGGLMGRIADSCGIQYRTLNESKGFAVRSTRIQVDKDKYFQKAEELIASTGISVIRGCVSRMTKEKELFHVELGKKELLGQKIIVTTGTFLNGLLHVGSEAKKGGRVGRLASGGLSSLLGHLPVSPSRFKTGTPPRLEKDSIDYSKLGIQNSDPKTLNFHCLNRPFARYLPQVSCFQTRTNEETLKIIRENREHSPLFNGQISGVGPRYCPSIEDKAFRYPERNTHHIFLEPEGLETSSVYPNGISSCLPREIQKNFVRTIKGLEQAKIRVFGYAVEYDVMNTVNLSQSLEHRDCPGLFFAGQVNGTSGYEEAAGQGIVAGINASLSVLKRDPFILSRDDSYIGVMIEDLVTNVQDEPYRLFSARAENRLFMREDNTIDRMYEYRKSLKLNTEIDQFQQNYMRQIKTLKKEINTKIFRSDKETKEYFQKKGYGPLEDHLSLGALLRRSKVNPVEVLASEMREYPLSVVQSVAISEKYAGYIKRAGKENEKLAKMGSKKLDWLKICDSNHISNECRHRIREVRPERFSQLQRIKGIRPATLVFVASML